MPSELVKCQQCGIDLDPARPHLYQLCDVCETIGWTIYRQPGLWKAALDFANENEKMASQKRALMD